ncbi:MAG: carboxylesterase/lipase family protein [Caulobacteraceae bacterium]
MIDGARVLAVGAAIVAMAASSAIGAARTEAGLVQGVRADGLTVYKGVPFAAPPVGALRWREPSPVAPWRGVRKADAFAPACMQTGVSMPGETPPKVSEDCLYLNIWTPARGAHEHLPVLMWIYGGGFANGSASMPLYWGDRLARRGLVVVTVAYRVGPFGYLALPELTAESPHRSSGNYGLEDQIAALAWVRRNISAFGGDPHRVTVAGQSAGAASVSLVMASPLAKGLFQRAIAESGGLFEPIKLAPGYLLPNAEKDGQAWAASLGAKSLDQLRALPAAALLKANADAITHPVIEPYALPASPYEVFAAGRQNDAPILVGTNADEARSLVTDLDKVRAATFAADIARRWGPLPPRLLAPYPHATDAQAVTARLDFERDLRFGWDVWTWARLEAATGRSSVYYYHFTHAPPFPAGSVYAGWGPSHFAELWYAFDHLGQESWRWTPADRRLARTMSGYWANFARSGDPNGPGLPHWPRFNTKDARVIYLDEPVTIGGVANLDTLSAFDAVYSQVRGAPLPTAAR